MKTPGERRKKALNLKMRGEAATAQSIGLLCTKRFRSAPRSFLTFEGWLPAMPQCSSSYGTCLWHCRTAAKHLQLLVLWYINALLDCTQGQMQSCLESL